MKEGEKKIPVTGIYLSLSDIVTENRGAERERVIPRAAEAVARV